MLTKTQRALLGLFAVVPLLAALGCSSPSTSAAPTNPSLTFPAKVHSANAIVAIPAKPTAIVSLSPTATEMLYAIGAGSQVKAVDNFSDYPSGAPMTNLDGTNPNVEAIASYHPDLVIVSQDSPGLEHGFRSLGVPLLSDPPAANLQQEYQQFAQLGAATGHSTEAAAEVSRIKAQVTSIVASTPKPSHPLSYYYELEQTYYSVTSSTFIGQVLGLLGLRSIADSARGAASSGGYPQLSGEFILKSNPNYVFLADTICCAQSAATVAVRPGWSGLAAVKSGRILALNDDIASRWGPRIVVLLQQAANELKSDPVGS